MSTSPDPDALRIGNFEREEAMKALGDHFAEGRLGSEEYEIRVSNALEAETRAQLRPLFEDLPAPRPAFLLPPPLPYPPPPPPYPPPPAYPPPPVMYPQAYVTPMVYLQPANLGPSPKSKVLAGVLQIVFPFGVGRFYTGHAGMAIGQLVVVLATFGVGAIWPFVDGIMLLVNGGTDSLGRRLRD